MPFTLENIFGVGVFGILLCNTQSEVLKAVYVAAGMLICMAAGYLLGSFSPAIWISKKHFGKDIRTQGSGNAGTTNMLRSHGKLAALFTLLGDLLKAVIACLIGYVCRGFEGAAIAGFFAVIGHIVPIYYHFKGGKGVLVAAATLLMLDPVAFLVVIAIFVIIVSFTKFVSLASVMAALFYPLVFVRLNVGRELGIAPALAVFTTVLIVIMHRKNISRLMKGEESKISFKKKSASEKPSSDEQNKEEQ